MSNQALDTFGVPEFFANTVMLEDAGNGMIRAIYCSKRGILMPIVSVVRPIENVIMIAPYAVDLCTKLMVGCSMHSH
jgi:hypothetical protein